MANRHRVPLLCAGALSLTAAGVSFGQTEPATTNPPRHQNPANRGSWGPMPCDSDAGCDDGLVCTYDRCVDSVCTYPPAVYGDVNGDETVDLPDILCVLDGFAGQFDKCSPDSLDIANCTPDGTIDLLDILAVLDGFAGRNPCCPNCETDADCNDDIACLDPGCVDNVCEYTDNCEDGNFCNGITECDESTGECHTGDWPICPPETPYCQEGEGEHVCVECLFGFLSGACPPDGDDCTEDRCLLGNACVYITDSDNDGVPNCCDNCEDTPSAAERILFYDCNNPSNPGSQNCACENPIEPVCPGGQALEGCDCSQLDSDGDGIYDCQDQSPCTGP